MEHCESDSSKPRIDLKCQVCRKEPFKYKCPRCEIKSCSLDCVKAHKTQQNCSGHRDKTKFVPTDRFGELDLLSDYRLLEEVNRAVEKFETDDPLQTLKSIQPKKIKEDIRHPEQNTQKLSLLQRVTRGFNKRFCRLLLLPEIFDKRKHNSTFFDKHSRLIFWKLELNFPHIDRKITLHNVPETKKLFELLDPFVTAGKSCGSLQNFTEEGIIKDLEDFNIYRSQGFGKLKVLLRIEHCRYAEDSIARFLELDIKKSILANLRGKTVVEYPTIFVTYSSHSQFFKTMDPKEASETQLSENTVSDQNSDSEVDLIKSDTTFGLFAKDMSDSDSESGQNEIDSPKKRKASGDNNSNLKSSEAKRTKLWRKQAKEYEDSSFMRNYALRREEGELSDSSVDNKAVEQEEEDPEKYKEYYDFYLKYYKGKFGLKDVETKKMEETPNKTSNLVSYDDSDDE